MKQISLRAARIDAGLTQKQAAEQIGVTPLTLQNWEHGIFEPRYSHLKKACEVYGRKPEDIFLPQS